MNKNEELTDREKEVLSLMFRITDEIMKHSDSMEFDRMIYLN